MHRGLMVVRAGRAAALCVLCLLVAMGCGSDNQTKPDPFDGAPHITDQQARSIPLGTTDQDLARKLGGRPTFTIGEADPASKNPSAVLPCWDYPVKGTEHTGRILGSSFTETLADQWRFCFRANRLADRRRMKPDEGQTKPPQRSP